MAESSSGSKLKTAPIIISICAIILSQMKPLYTYFERPDIDLVVGRNMSVYETWGNLSANVFIQLVNRGESGGVVERMAMFIRSKDTAYSHVMPAQSFYLQPDTIGQNEVVSQIPFSNVTIGSGSIWTGFVASFKDWSRTQLATVHQITQDTQADLNSKFVPNGPAVTIEPELMGRISDFTRGNLGDFDIGEYQLLVLGWTLGDEAPSLRKAFNFSVFETDKSRLYVKEDSYRYGAGIVYPINQSIGQQATFNVTLAEIKDRDIIARLYNAYEQAQL